MSLTPSEKQIGTPSLKHDRWRGVAEAMTAMTASPDGLSLSNTIESVITETLDVSACAFLVLDETVDQIVFETSQGLQHPKHPPSDFNAFRSWLSTCPEPLVIEDSRTVEWPEIIDHVSHKPHPALIVQAQVDPALYMILIVFGRSVGKKFTIEDIEVARALTGHAGLTVRHVLREENARREVVGRTALYEVGKRISSSLAIEEVLKLIIDSLQRVVPYDAAVIFLLEHERNRITVKSSRGYTRDAGEMINMKVGDGISGWAATTGLAVIVPDVHSDDRYVNLRPETRSEMAVPLMKGPEVIGVFNIESDRMDAYDQSDRALLESFASQAAVAIQNARLYEESVRTRQLEKELEVAGEIQRTLMPRNIPSVPGLSLTVYNEQSMEVGGDFYDVFTLGSKYLALAVGDVAGKGVPGAIMMARLYTVFHEYAVLESFLPDYVMGVVNERLHDEGETGRFATLFYGLLSLENGTMSYCNAGHPSPILCRTDGSVTQLDKGGLILGPFLNSAYEMGTTELVEGDILVLYTDGVIEARNGQGEEFGVHGLTQVLRTCPGLEADAVKECLTNTLRAHTGGTTHHDDVTIITLKVIRGFHSGLQMQ
ncbi:MAG: GAF domain-containing SpoIIE family protein phosphatase [Gemmatimonadota bacterium]|nr:GAF domain-containing SpoIIE family protein phosphatase [Gemmatimonadota bacterium]